MTPFTVPAEVSQRLATGQRTPTEMVDARELPTYLARHVLRVARTVWHPGEPQPTLYVEELMPPPESAIPPAAMAEPESSRCRSCQSPIFWLVGKSGKRVPVECAPRHCSPTGKGKRLLLFTREGTTVQGFECQPSDPGARAGHESHFAHCPNANQHRSRRALEKAN